MTCYTPNSGFKKIKIKIYWQLPTHYQSSNAAFDILKRYAPFRCAILACFEAPALQDFQGLSSRLSSPLSSIWRRLSAPVFQFSTRRLRACNLLSWDLATASRLWSDFSRQQLHASLVKCAPQRYQFVECLHLHLCGTMIAIFRGMIQQYPLMQEQMRLKGSLC